MGEQIRGLLTLVALSAALAAACWAQTVLRDSDDHGLWFVLVAFLLAVLAGRLTPPTPEPPPAAAPVLRPVRPRWALFGAWALAVSVALEWSERAHAVQLLSWLMSVVAWLLAYRPVPDGSAPESRALPAALLLSALLLTCYALDSVPGGLYGDEAALGVLVNRMLDGSKPIAPFTLGLGQIPMLFAWLDAIGVASVDPAIFGLRLCAAVGGALCVLPVFYLLRRDFGVPLAAAAALLLLGSPAHQHLSRMALPESWIRPTAFTALAGLYIALRTGAASRYVAAGVAIGVCFYMASKAVLLPPILLLSVLALGAVTFPRCLPQWRGGLLVLGAAVLTFLPMLVCYAKLGFQDILIGHHARWIETPAPGGPLAHAASVARLLLDGPEVSPFSAFEGRNYIVSAAEGAVMVVGLGLALARPRRGITAFLLGWLVAGLGSLLLDSSPNQIPHALLVSCLPALFSVLIVDAARSALRATRRRFSVALAVAATLPLMAANVSSYFDHDHGAAAWQGEDFSALGLAMQEFKGTHHVALVTPPMSWDLNSTLLYLAPGFYAPTKLTELDSDKAWVPDAIRPVAFLVMVSRVPLLKTIQERFPRAKVELRTDSAGRPMLAVVLVSAADARARPNNDLSLQTSEFRSTNRPINR